MKNNVNKMWLKQAFFVRNTCFNYWKNTIIFELCPKNFFAFVYMIGVSVLVCRVSCHV